MQRETYKLKSEESQRLLSVLNDALREYRHDATRCQSLGLVPETEFWQRRITATEALVNLFITADEILTCKLTPEGL